ncbi:MAG: hypothetical protein AB1349_07150 [Elusimicrobiota bacterium]
MRRTIYTTEALENLVNEAEIRAVQSAIMSPFWWIVLILLLVIGIQSLIRFHRLVGPIYALERIIEQIKQGCIGGHIYLRRHDELKDLAKGIEDMSNTLKCYIEKDRKIIDSITAQLTEMTDLTNQPELKNRLLKIKDQLAKITTDFHIKG